MTLDSQPFKELAHPKYSKEECKNVVEYLMALKTGLIRDFLKKHAIPVLGTKEDLHERIEECLDKSNLKYEDLINCIDAFAPCGKQHIILYEGPESHVKQWKKDEYVSKVLKDNGFSKYLNSRLPLILPEDLAISSIAYKPGQELKIYAVERRDYTERREEFDKKDKTTDGKGIELRAFIHQVARGVIIFTWDLVSNTATLQISQLPSASGYEEKEEKFNGLIKSCLDITTNFEKVDIKQVITKLNELEEKSTPEARSHNIDYKSPGGRKCSFYSPTYRESILGEEALDNDLCDIRKKSIGHLGNFYWLPISKNQANNNPLQDEVHTILVGDKSRINFTTPNKDEDIKHVVSRVRTLCR